MNTTEKNMRSFVIGIACGFLVTASNVVFVEYTDIKWYILTSIQLLIVIGITAAGAITVLRMTNE